MEVRHLSCPCKCNLQCCNERWKSTAGCVMCLDYPSGRKSQSSASMGSQDDVLDDVVVPPDLPLEAIAEEVQNSWHLKV